MQLVQGDREQLKKKRKRERVCPRDPMSGRRYEDIKSLANLHHSDVWGVTGCATFAEQPVPFMGGWKEK